MAEADANARKAHKSAGPDGANRMANGARMRVLEKALGVKLKTNRTVERPRSPFQQVTDKPDEKGNERIKVTGPTTVVS